MYLAWKAGAIGEIDTSRDPALKELPSFYAKRNCWYGASFPSPADIKGRKVVGVDKILWGNDYPHYEGTFPYNLESLRLTFSDIPERERRMLFAENAAALYGFDLEKLTPMAEKYGPTPEQIDTPLPHEEIPQDSTCYLFQAARRQAAEKRAS